MDATLARELLTFLAPGSRPDLQGPAAGYLLGLTATEPGRALLAAQPALLEALGALTDAPAPAPTGDAFHALVNLAADPGVHDALLGALPGLLAQLADRTLDPGCRWAGRACAVLANLTREEGPCHKLLAVLWGQEKEPGPRLPSLLEALCDPGYNPHAPLHYLGPLLSNLTQLPRARAFLLDRDRCVVQRLLPLIQFPDSTVCRGGVVGTLRNCCFEHSHHEWLLGPQVDVLPFLLLPLAGPEEFSEEETERLPMDLQYLPPEKQREPDPDIRKMLIEAIMLLTATKAGRKLVRDQGAYLVLRELHSWEPDPSVRSACEKLIQVLIGDEPGPGLENLLEATVPPEVEQRLRQLDQQEEADRQRESEETERQATPGASPPVPAEGWLTSAPSGPEEPGRPSGTRTG
ncbi:protein HGH1 homolog [Tachyglossus aculeatus]|uniref:protein HGH1 homolog n=1 Tax=Tachyglossus aculeatus TaxID=9261 RepID=UPI0018F61694|nr:protein HGH1 homolog [Tachyglossus aculeatus]